MREKLEDAIKSLKTGCASTCPEPNLKQFSELYNDPTVRNRNIDAELLEIVRILGDTHKDVSEQLKSLHDILRNLHFDRSLLPHLKELAAKETDGMQLVSKLVRDKHFGPDAYYAIARCAAGNCGAAFDLKQIFSEPWLTPSLRKTIVSAYEKSGPAEGLMELIRNPLLAAHKDLFEEVLRDPQSASLSKRLASFHDYLQLMKKLENNETLRAKVEPLARRTIAEGDTSPEPLGELVSNERFKPWMLEFVESALDKGKAGIGDHIYDFRLALNNDHFGKRMSDKGFAKHIWNAIVSNPGARLTDLFFSDEFKPELLDVTLYGIRQAPDSSAAFSQAMFYLVRNPTFVSRGLDHGFVRKLASTSQLVEDTFGDIAPWYVTAGYQGGSVSASGPSAYGQILEDRQFTPAVLSALDILAKTFQSDENLMGMEYKSSVLSRFSLAAYLGHKGSMVQIAQDLAKAYRFISATTPENTANAIEALEFLNGPPYSKAYLLDLCETVDYLAEKKPKDGTEVFSIVSRLHRNSDGLRMIRKVVRNSGEAYESILGSMNAVYDSYTISEEQYEEYTATARAYSRFSRSKNEDTKEIYYAVVPPRSKRTDAILEYISTTYKDKAGPVLEAYAKALRSPSASADLLKEEFIDGLGANLPR